MLKQIHIDRTLKQSLYLACCLIIPNVATAVEFEGRAVGVVQVTGAIDFYHDYLRNDELTFSGSYQPRSGEGLVGVSASVDLSGFGAFAAAAVAVYGTDSTRSNVGSLPPDLIASGIGVEPMIDIQAQANSGVHTPIGTTAELVSDGHAQGEAVGKVQHRVILNPEITIPEEILGDVTNQLNNIPLQVLWAYDVSGFGGFSAKFEMSVTSPTGDCANGIGGECGGFIFSAISEDTANSGSMPFTAVAMREGREAIYDILVGAQAAAGTHYGEPGSSAIQAVFDPFLTVDQNWEYAEFFKVEQESTLNPGEWVGITRDYLSPVPIPPAAWLFGSALLGLGAIKRRQA